MSDSRERRNGDSLVDWTQEPEFHFETEVEALQTLQELGHELQGAREQVRQVMRYLATAVQAAGKVREDGEPISKQAIIRESTLARQTIYDILGEK